MARQERLRYANLLAHSGRNTWAIKGRKKLFRRHQEPIGMVPDDESACLRYSTENFSVWIFSHLRYVESYQFEEDEAVDILAVPLSKEQLMALYQDLLETLQDTHTRKQEIEDALKASANDLRQAIVSQLGIPEENCMFNDAKDIDGHRVYDITVRLANETVDFGEVTISAALKVIAGTCYVRFDNQLSIKVEVAGMNSQSFAPAAIKFGEILKVKATKRPE